MSIKGIPLGMSIAEKIAYLDKARADDAEHFAHCVTEWWPQIRAGFAEPVSISEKAVELKACPFCGSVNIDAEGWASTDRAGPACDDCGGTADTVDLWNSRPAISLHQHPTQEADRQRARDAMIRGYHDCGGGFQRVRSCDCDDSRIDGCKARVEAIAAALAAAPAPVQADRWQEEWQPVVGREDQYEVSNLGYLRTSKGAIVGQWPNNQGYMLARLSGPREMVRVHRLVAQAFVANPENKPAVNHIDCIRSNNAASNLEWCTQAEDLAHSDRLGRIQRDYWIGKRSPSACLNDDTVREIRSFYESGQFSYEGLADHFGLSKRAIGRLIKRETYADVQ